MPGLELGDGLEPVPEVYTANTCELVPELEPVPGLELEPVPNLL